MYYVFEAEKTGKNNFIMAEVIGEMPNFLTISHEWSWWSDYPLPVRFPETAFAIDKTTYQDSYYPGSIFELHSEKLASIIQRAGVKCEYFPVKTIYRNSTEPTSSKYFAFHLMETHEVIDYSNSDLKEIEEPIPEIIKKLRIKRGSNVIGKHIDAIELHKEILSSSIKLLRDKIYPHMVFVHESLKKAFDAAGIQGCRYTDYKSYRDIDISEIGIVGRT